MKSALFLFVVALPIVCMATSNPGGSMESSLEFFTVDNNNTHPTPNNSLGDFFLNRCFMENPPGWQTQFAVIITHRYVNPRSVVAGCVWAVLLLPFLFQLGWPPHERISTQWNKTLHFFFLRARLICLHFLHRMNYAVLLICGLYCVFRQGRPCEINGQKIGGYYGMPSGDAMGGGIVGAFLLGTRPPGRHWLTAISGVVVMAVVDWARVISGFHSIGMVITGSAIGFSLHHYSIRAPLWHIWLDAAVSTFGVALSMGIDNSLVFGHNNQNNLWSWLFWGAGIQAFVCLMFTRMVQQGFITWKTNYLTALERLNTLEWPIAPQKPSLSLDVVDQASERLLSVDSELPVQQQGELPLQTSILGADWAFTLFALFVCFVFQLFSVLIEVHDWIGIQGPAQNSGGPSPL